MFLKFLLDFKENSEHLHIFHPLNLRKLIEENVSILL